MNTPNTTSSTKAAQPRLRLGQAVHVNAHAAWLPATVTSIAHARIGVTYHTAPPNPLAAAVARWVVRPADGIRLRPVHQLAAGDEVVAFDGTTHTVAAVWQCPNRWWVIGYRNGEHGTLAPTAILRLTDPTRGVADATTPGDTPTAMGGPG